MCASAISQSREAMCALYVPTWCIAMNDSSPILSDLIQIDGNRNCVRHARSFVISHSAVELEFAWVSGSRGPKCFWRSPPLHRNGGCAYRRAIRPDQFLVLRYNRADRYA